MIKLFGKIALAQGGNATIELALIAPVLATMIIGIADLSTAFGRKLEIEQASQRAIEKVMQTTGDTTVESTIKNEAVCQVNGPGADGTCAAGRISSANVTVTYRLECTAGGTRTETLSSSAAAFDALECGSGADEARYILATVTDTFTPMFPVYFGSASDGLYHLSTTAGVRVQ